MICYLFFKNIFYFIKNLQTKKKCFSNIKKIIFPQKKTYHIFLQNLFYKLENLMQVHQHTSFILDIIIYYFIKKFKIDFTLELWNNWRSQFFL